MKYVNSGHAYKTRDPYDSIRGLLCHKCNLGLHYVENNEWLSAAMEYLKEKENGPEIKKASRS